MIIIRKLRLSLIWIFNYLISIFYQNVGILHIRQKKHLCRQCSVFRALQLGDRYGEPPSPLLAYDCYVDIVKRATLSVGIITM